MGLTKWAAKQGAAIVAVTDSPLSPLGAGCSRDVFHLRPWGRALRQRHRRHRPGQRADRRRGRQTAPERPGPPGRHRGRLVSRWVRWSPNRAAAARSGVDRITHPQATAPTRGRARRAGTAGRWPSRPPRNGPAGRCPAGRDPGPADDPVRGQLEAPQARAVTARGSGLSWGAAPESSAARPAPPAGGTQAATAAGTEGPGQGGLGGRRLLPRAEVIEQGPALPGGQPARGRDGGQSPVDGLLQPVAAGRPANQLDGLGRFDDRPAGPARPPGRRRDVGPAAATTNRRATSRSTPRATRSSSSVLVASPAPTAAISSASGASRAMSSPTGNAPGPGQVGPGQRGPRPRSTAACRAAPHPRTTRPTAAPAQPNRPPAPMTWRAAQKAPATSARLGRARRRSHGPRRCRAGPPVRRPGRWRPAAGTADVAESGPRTARGSGSGNRGPPRLEQSGLADQGRRLDGRHQVRFGVGQQHRQLGPDKAGPRLPTDAAARPADGRPSTARSNRPASSSVESRAA